ncbi:MAG: hypothetical protein Q7S47_01540, partial [bacterium]|nr:hypothetical protein [bacterium]
QHLKPSCRLSRLPRSHPWYFEIYIFPYIREYASERDTLSSIWGAVQIDDLDAPFDDFLLRFRRRGLNSSPAVPMPEITVVLLSASYADSQHVDIISPAH